MLARSIDLLYKGGRSTARGHFLGEKALLVGFIGMHDDHGSLVDEKIHMRPTYMQNLESIRST